VFIFDLHAGASTDDVVKLVFVMRSLWIRGSGGENVNSGA
jgi:hypothetical protein